MTWNPGEFDKILEEVLRSGSFRGEAVDTKEALYGLIGKAVCVSDDTVRGWRGSGSTGPSGAQGKKKVLDLFGEYISPEINYAGGGYLMNNISKTTLDDPNDVLGDISETAKGAILDTYRRMYDYIREVYYLGMKNKGPDENLFVVQIFDIIDRNRIALPNEIYNGFTELVDVIDELHTKALQGEEDGTFLMDDFAEKSMDELREFAEEYTDFIIY